MITYFKTVIKSLFLVLCLIFQFIYMVITICSGSKDHVKK